MQLTFEIPDNELERVSTAFCQMAGHAPCQTQQCLLEQVGRIVVTRVLSHEKLVVSSKAVSEILPLVLSPTVIPE